MRNSDDDDSDLPDESILVGAPRPEFVQNSTFMDAGKNSFWGSLRLLGPS